MGMTVIGCTGAALGLFPYAAAMRNKTIIVVLVLLQLMPLAMAIAPATLSSACDDLLEQLTELSMLGDMGHKARCNNTRKSYRGLNRGQGLGFLMFSIVIDKRKLFQIAVSLISVASTILTGLLTLGSNALTEYEGMPTISTPGNGTTP